MELVVYKTLSNSGNCFAKLMNNCVYTGIMGFHTSVEPSTKRSSKFYSTDGNVFSRICDYVHGGGGGLYPWWRTEDSLLLVGRTRQEGAPPGGSVGKDRLGLSGRDSDCDSRNMVCPLPVRPRLGLPPPSTPTAGSVVSVPLNDHEMPDCWEIFWKRQLRAGWVRGWTRHNDFCQCL